jgi:dolichol-phosphate mannosyltransferase
MTETRPLLSVITPSYNEERNLPALFERLKAVLDDPALGVDWEWIVIDDHSADSTFAVAAKLAESDSRVRVLRFSRNFGSHAGIACGIDHARGTCSVVMAADLQDPPETIPALLRKWRDGAQVVWAVRAARPGETAGTLAFARLYYMMMRRVVGLTSMPATGADFFLLDGRVMAAIRSSGERNVSILANIAWMGFRQGQITYDKQARAEGQSGWTLAKKVKLVIDSLTSLSYLPIRAMSVLGLGIAVCGILYSVVVLFNAVFGHPVEGWSSLMVAVLLLGGVQMLMLGTLGEYIWRSLDESRKRPRYLIEDAVGVESARTNPTAPPP